MKGLTLIEVLVTMLIFSIISLAILLSMTVAQRSFFMGDTETELREGLTRAISTIDKDLSQTRSTKINLNLGATSNTISFPIPADLNGDGTVIDAMGAVEWSTNITYSRNAANQLIRTFGGVNKIIATNIISLQFKRTQDKIIQVDITARKTATLGRQITDTEQLIVKMRN